MGFWPVSFGHVAAGADSSGRWECVSFQAALQTEMRSKWVLVERQLVNGTGTVGVLGSWADRAWSILGFLRTPLLLALEALVSAEGYRL